MDTPSAGTSDSTAHIMRTRLNELAAALIAGGLTVRLGDGTLVAKNPAASDTVDPHGKAMNPGLSQTVTLTVHDDGTLHWYWCWSGPTRNAPLEPEYMCGAEQIDRAAGKIGRVLALAGT
jgi:hypothetical protein